MLFTLCLANCQQNPKNVYYPRHQVISNEDMLRTAVHFDHVGADFEEGHRHLTKFRWSDVSILDCDNDHSEDPFQWVTPEACYYLFPNVCFALVPSRHDRKEKGGKPSRPRFHVYFPHRKFETAEEETALKQKIQTHYPFFDPNAVDSARFIFGHDPSYVIWHPGTMTIEESMEKYKNPFIAAREAPEEPPLLPQAEEMPERSPTVAPPVAAEALPSEKKTQAMPVPAVIAEGTRNSTLSRAAARLVKRYGVTETAKEKFLETARRCTPPLPARELAAIWKSAEKFGQRVTREAGYIPPDLYSEEPPSLALQPADASDMGEAKVLTREYGGVLAYTTSTHFMVFTGTCWQESKERAMGLCQQLLERQLQESTEAVTRAEKMLNTLGISPKGKGKKMPAAGNPWQGLWKKASEYREFIVNRRDSRYIEGTLKMAQPMVLKEYDDFDSQAFLLNTPSGTYDLQKGMEGRQPHRAEDFLTKMTSVSPADTGEALWQQCLEVFFSGDAALIAYVQQIVGLSAIGKVYQESLIIAYGAGSNGKSTFWNVIARVLGTYSGGLSADVLTVSCRRNVKPEMAELKGKRLVIASELEEGTRLNTAFMKQLCSTDAIAAEKKYKDPFQFLPTHTLVLCTNHLPRVGANDKGTWRRLIVIPFDAKLEGKPDVKNYADYLVQEAGGAVLKWIIEGAKEVIDAGFHLPIPPVVSQAVEYYRDSNDWLSRFLEECCEEDPSYTVSVGDLYDTYQAYSFRHGEYTRNRIDFSQALSSAGFKRGRNRQMRYMEGLRLKAAYMPTN